MHDDGGAPSSRPRPDPALAREFRRRPFGARSADLHALLHHMRAQPIPGKHFLFMLATNELWALGRYSPDDASRTTVDVSTTFTNLEDAEWHVFKIRWEEMFGEHLDDRVLDGY